jgi:hypothetical protein
MDMGKWKIHGCPRCGGSLIIDRDEDGWYESCINCAFRNDLKVIAKAPTDAELHIKRSKKSAVSAK